MPCVPRVRLTTFSVAAAFAPLPVPPVRVTAGGVVYVPGLVTVTMMSVVAVASAPAPDPPESVIVTPGTAV